MNSAPATAFFVGPANISRDAYRTAWPSVDYIPFDPGHFRDVASYNQWMLLPDLYARFSSFEFVLVCQSDAILVEPLPVHEEWEFDYLGAPWVPPWMVGWNPRRRHLARKGWTLPKRPLVVGNGGLSLRRTSVFRQHLRFPKFQKPPNEDTAISYFHRRLGIRLADEAVAARFFMELGARSWRPMDPIPRVFGFHALDQHNPRLEDELIANAEASLHGQ